MMEKWSRVGSYLEKYADDLVFDQFQEGYLKREGIDGFMKDVPVPMSTGDVVDFHTQKGLDVMNVVKNMIRIIGMGSHGSIDKIIDLCQSNRPFGTCQVTAHIHNTGDPVML